MYMSCTDKVYNVVAFKVTSGSLSVETYHRCCFSRFLFSKLPPYDVHDLTETFVLKYEQLKGSSVLPIYTDFLDNLCNFLKNFKLFLQFLTTVDNFGLFFTLFDKF